MNEVIQSQIMQEVETLCLMTAQRSYLPINRRLHPDPDIVKQVDLIIPMIQMTGIKEVIANGFFCLVLPKDDLEALVRSHCRPLGVKYHIIDKSDMRESFVKDHLAFQLHHNPRSFNNIHMFLEKVDKYHPGRLSDASGHVIFEPLKFALLAIQHAIANENDTSARAAINDCRVRLNNVLSECNIRDKFRLIDIVNSDGYFIHKFVCLGFMTNIQRVMKACEKNDLIFISRGLHSVDEISKWLLQCGINYGMEYNFNNFDYCLISINKFIWAAT